MSVHPTPMKVPVNIRSWMNKLDFKLASNGEETQVPLKLHRITLVISFPLASRFNVYPLRPPRLELLATQPSYLQPN
jgi:hypothetical protein